jgi:hypothetical protein
MVRHWLGGRRFGVSLLAPHRTFAPESWPFSSNGLLSSQPTIFLYYSHNVDVSTRDDTT